MPIDEDQLAAEMLAGRSGNQSSYAKALIGVVEVARLRIRRKFGWTGSDLEDLVQEVLLTVHLNKASWDRDRPLLPWLHAIADHKALDAIRQRRRHGRLVATGVSLDGMEEHVPAPEPDRDTLGLDRDRHLASLPAREREVVHGLSVQGRSVPELAAALGIKETAVRVALHRGLKRLAAAARVAGS